MPDEPREPTQSDPRDPNGAGWPDSGGHFATFGGRFVPEIAMAPLLELERAWTEVQASSEFWSELLTLLSTFAGRPTPLFEAVRLSARVGGRIRIFLKREDLLTAGTTSITSCLGQALLARRLGKARVVCETGSGRHGLAAASACARLDLGCTVYMGAEDVRRQAPGIAAIEALGARLTVVDSGERKVCEAMTCALRDWMFHSADTCYMARAPLGPHPYPRIMRDLGAIVGLEAHRQIQDAAPDSSVAAVVATPDHALALFYAFVTDEKVRLLAAEAGGVDAAHPGRNACAMTLGTSGVLHGFLGHVLQDEQGEVLPTLTIAPGLDYPACPPELSYLKSIGRVEPVAVPDGEAASAFGLLARTEGLLASLGSAHSIACALRLASELEEGSVVLVNVCGRGDQDASMVGQAQPEPVEAP